jgi:C1A family cysteine protease
MYQSRIGRKYGWRPELPSTKREAPVFKTERTAPLPSFVDLRGKFPPCYDQLQLGSCTVNALAGVVEFDRIKEGLPAFIPSRLFIYWNEREMEGTTASDAGAVISDGVKAINEWGAPPETLWPYVQSQFAVKPPAAAYTAGEKVRALAHESVTQTIGNLKAVLAGGFPFVFGFSVYESFESDAVAASGIVPMPQAGEPSIGGHAVVCCGYSEQSTLSGVPAQHFICRNSWGVDWGMHGYFAIPYAYLLNSTLASDFWKVASIT